MITILLADDHQVVREGFRQLLEAQPDMTVVGEAGDGRTAIALVKQLRPDVLVLDMVLPDLRGLEVLAQVRKNFPQTHVIILSMYDDQAYVLKALRDGAKAYLLKQSSSRELVQAIHEAMLNRHWLSQSLVELVVTAYLQAVPREPDDPYEALSAREQQVLWRLGEGQTNGEIAAALGLSTGTIETYRRRLRGKLGLQSQADLLRYALRHSIRST